MRRVVAKLGASEQMVSVEQMRQAIATWYLHVQREETGGLQIVEEAHHMTVQELSAGLGTVQGLLGHHSASAATPASKSHEQGRWLWVSLLAMYIHVIVGFFGPPAIGNQDARRHSVALLVSIVVFLFALLEICVANSAGAPQGETCESPLQLILYCTGLSSIVAVLFNCPLVLLKLMRISDGEVGKRISELLNCPIIITLMNCIQVILSITGMFWVFASSPRHCGTVVWQTCDFVYVLLPVAAFLVLCCGPCCCYCCIGGHVTYEGYHMDRSLMEP